MASNLTQIQFLRSGIQICAKVIENLLMIMVLRKGKTLKRHTDMCLLAMAKSLPDFGVKFTSMQPIISCGGLMVVSFDFWRTIR